MTPRPLDPLSLSLRVCPLLIVVALTACAPELGSHTAAIIGGQPVEEDGLWSTVHIAASSDRMAGCGGTLLSPTIVLTAAHCVQNPEAGLRGTPEEVVVGWGTAALESGQVPMARAAAVQEVFVHPDYTYEPPGTHDIAVLRLATPIQDQAFVAVPSLAVFQDNVPVGSTLTLMGAGLQQEGDTPSEPDGRIHRVDVTLNRIDERHIAVGARGMTACAGDSGGPAYAEFLDQRWVVGVTSAADERSPQPTSCGGPASYTLAPFYYDWIRQVAGDGLPGGSDAGVPADGGLFDGATFDGTTFDGVTTGDAGTDAGGATSSGGCGVAGASGPVGLLPIAWAIWFVGRRRRSR